ncbi:MAG TPA: A24 family peptidase [Janthinobacterium sp.]|nr:A24 family peptidase [Janthinobacterium sp.]
MNEFRALLDLLQMLVIDPRTGGLMLLLVIAGVSDVRLYKIPNWLTLGGTLFALTYGAFVPLEPHAGLGTAAAGLLLGFLLMLPLYGAGVMGAGDVKLMAMVGAFLGFPSILFALIASFIVGGIGALFYAISRRVLGRMLANVRTALQLLAASAVTGGRPLAHGAAFSSVGKLPYGVSIGAGTILYLVARQLGYL